MSLGKPGHIRKKLAEMLTEKGFPVESTDLVSAEGHYRIYGNLEDTLRWEAWTYETQPSRHLISYSTMTECVNRGFEVSQDHGNAWWVDALGKETVRKTGD